MQNIKTFSYLVEEISEPCYFIAIIFVHHKITFQGSVILYAKRKKTRKMSVNDFVIYLHKLLDIYLPI